MNQFFYGVILFIPAFFTNISGKIKLDTLSFLLERSFLIAKHSKCILSFMGVSELKISCMRVCNFKTSTLSPEKLLRASLNMHVFPCKPFVGVITGVVVGLVSVVERKFKP